MRSITVAISTLGQRLLDIDPEALKPGANIDYLILLQGPDTAPSRSDLDAHITKLSARTDISVLILPSMGVAKSRNAALQSAKGDIILFADDDTILQPQSCARIYQYFQDNSGASFMCGFLCDQDGHIISRKPVTEIYPAKWYNCGRVGTPVMAVKRQDIITAGMRFDEDFGSGTDNLLGEEFIFLVDCLRNNLHGFHIPVGVAYHHPDHSSGDNFSPTALSARKKVFRRAFDHTHVAVRFGFALRHWRSIGGGMAAIRFALSNA